MNRRRWATLALILVALAALFVSVRDAASLETLIRHEERMRATVEATPVWSFLVALGIYTAASLIPGTTGKSIVFGWLFGLWSGVILVNVGLTLAAIMAFAMSRYVFQEAVRRRFGRFMRSVDQHLARNEGEYLLTLRLLHAPYTLTNYVAGASAVSLWRFWWTTQLGLLPGNVAFVYAGASLPSLRQLAERGVWSLINFPLLAALTVLTLMPVALRWVVKRAGARGGNDTSGGWETGGAGRTERRET